MIRLKHLREPIWCDLPHGVRVQLRRLTSLEHAAAEHAARRRLLDLRRGEDVLEEYGLEHLPDPLSDLNVAAGLGELIALTEMTVRAVICWEGVLSEEGPAAPTRAVVMQLLLQPDLRRALTAALTEASQVLVAEGNACAGSGTGSGPAVMAAASATAAAAASTMSPAPAGYPDAAGDTAPR